jgi:hypothetical protein
MPSRTCIQWQEETIAINQAGLPPSLHRCLAANIRLRPLIRRRLFHVVDHNNVNGATG